MKKSLSAISALTLLAAVLIPALFAESAPVNSTIQIITPASASANADASEKEEVVYGILNADGTVDGIYVVNIFDGGTFTDHGDYSETMNLTDASKLTRTGDVIAMQSDAKRFSYQGTLVSDDLPWTIAIGYVLNGTGIAASELAGKSGALEIKLSITQNTAFAGSSFENYALQVTVTLDETLCENIKAGGATAAEAAGSRQLSYIVMPGKTADISITADVDRFEMDPITINGIKMVFDLDIDMSEYTDQFSELAEAAKSLDDGAGKLWDGAAKLADGINSYTDGLKTYKDGLSASVKGAGDVKTGTASLSDGLSQLTAQNATLVMGADRKSVV